MPCVFPSGKILLCIISLACYHHSPDHLQEKNVTVRFRCSSHMTWLIASQVLAIILRSLRFRPSAQSATSAPAINKLEMLPLLLVASLLHGTAAFYLPGAYQQLRSVEYQLMLSYRSRAEGLQKG